MKSVIRIEHPIDGFGLWRSERDGEQISNGFSFIVEMTIKHRNFPTPSKDGIDIQHYHFCAFKSIEQVREWIKDDWWKEILDAGFKVLLIDLSGWQEGQYQVVFRRDQVLQTKDISDLFKTNTKNSQNMVENKDEHTAMSNKKNVFVLTDREIKITYLALQTLTRIGVKNNDANFAVCTDSLRASLRNYICNHGDLSCEAIQDEYDANAKQLANGLFPDIKL